MRSTVIPRLHLVTDDRVLSAPGFVRNVERVLEGLRSRQSRPHTAERATGGRQGSSESVSALALHLRGPATSGRALWEIGQTIMPLCRAAEVPVLVNDRIDLALLLGAEGVHLGARSLPPEIAREILGAEPLIGASVHSVAEVREGREVDFLIAGSAYPTPSHPGERPTGPSGVQDIVAGADGLPVLAIGGINLDRIAEIMASGAYGVALITAVWRAGDPGEAVTALLDRIETSLQTTGERSGEGTHGRTETVS